MNARAVLVQRRSPLQQPSQRICDLSPGYRAAAEALRIAADHGCDARLYEALWRLLQREHDTWLGAQERPR